MADKPTKRFEIWFPDNRNFTGTRLRGLRFTDGVAFTDDATTASDYRWYGFKVIDHAANQTPDNPPPPKAA